jgi:hypothetical protein
MKQFAFLVIIAISQFAFSEVIPPTDWCRYKYYAYCSYPHPTDVFQSYSQGHWCYSIGDWKTYKNEVEIHTKLRATRDAENLCKKTFGNWDKTEGFSARRVSPWKVKTIGGCSAIYSADFDCQNKSPRDDFSDSDNP